MIAELQHIGMIYETAEGEVEALRDVSFAVEEGEFVSLVGPSGCGKSTLLGILAGLEQPTSGSVTVFGEKLAAPSARVGYMPQKDQLFPWRSIRSNAVLGLELRREREERLYRRTEELLEEYGLGSFAASAPHELSGGMRQRSALIRTLAPDPGFLLLDEPFSALDAQTRLTVSSDIGGIIRQQGKTALLVTHDIAESIRLSDRIVVLTPRPGRVRNIHVLPTELRALSPSARQVHPAFAEIYTEIGRELGLDG